MISQDDKDKPITDWKPYIIGMTLTAILSTFGSEMAKWVVDELRDFRDSKKEKKPEEK